MLHSPKMIDKMQKILRLLDGAATEGEAEAALSRATAMLEGVGLTVEEFREQFGADADEHPEIVKIIVERGAFYIKSGKAYSHHHSAAHVVAIVCGLKIVYFDRTNICGEACLKYNVVGTSEAISTASRLLESLLISFDCILKNWKLSSQEYQGCSWGRRKMTSDFTLGFWSGLSSRVKKNAQTTLEEAKKHALANSNNEHGIIRAADIIRSRTMELVKSEENQWVNEMGNLRLTGAAKRNIGSTGAYEAGRSASNSVSLSVSSQRQIAHK